MSYNSTYVSNNGDMSQAQVIGGPIDIRSRTSLYAISATATGAPVGTLQLQGIIANPTSPGGGAGAGQGSAWPATGWVPMGSPVSINAAGTTVWDIGPSGMDAVQVVYTKTSGTGTLAVGFNVKGT